MWFMEITDYLISNANEVCFLLAMVCTLLFYRQYKKYEEEAERQEMINGFLPSSSLQRGIEMEAM